MISKHFWLILDIFNFDGRWLATLLPDTLKPILM